MQTLLPTSTHEKKRHNSCILTSNFVSPPSSPSFSNIGDYIGMESCYDLRKNEDFFTKEEINAADPSQSYWNKIYQRRSAAAAAKKKEYPPPIPLLARTENLHSHMPWVLKRYYTTDGRLILREERVKHHEYFRAHRSNGRLTLQLVHLEDVVLMHPLAANDRNDNQCSVDEEKEEEKTEESDESDVGGNEETDYVNESEEIHDNETEESVHNNESVPEVGVSGNNNGGGGAATVPTATKWLNYSSSVRISSSSCFLGLPVPAINPVRT